MAMLSRIGKRIAPWRFIMFFALLVVGVAMGIASLGWSKGVLAGFGVAASTFLLSCIWIFRYDAHRMRAASKDNDANRPLLLFISFLLTVVILAAIVAELGQDQLRWTDKALVTVSMMLVWLFANAVYTLHYAHLFYSAGDGGEDCAGLSFPATKEPLLSDFVYFSYTLGVAVQTSDVEVTSRDIRKVVTIHCVIGWFFNLGVLALTINVLGSR